MITHLTMFALKIYFEFSGMVAVQLSMFLFAVFFNSHINLTYLFMFVNNFFNFFKKSLWSSFKRRRRDLNPRAAINDLLPFQGSPFSHLGTSAFMAESHSFKESDIQFAAPDPVLPDSAIQ